MKTQESYTGIGIDQPENFFDILFILKSNEMTIFLSNQLDQDGGYQWLIMHVKPVEWE